MSDPNPLDNVRIVLVHTSHPGNIGAAARAMKNMGLSQLYLVAPRRFPDEQASWRAANAGDLLENAVVCESLQEAVADCGLVVGTSARQRTIPWPLLDSRGAAEQLHGEAAHYPVALLFGREDRGLTNEELRSCTLHVNIPADENYSSLNLAMAVQVLCYELRMAHLAGTLDDDPMADWDLPPASAADLERYFAHLEQTLGELGFLRADAPKQLMTRLRRLYQRARPDTMEISILRGILTGTQQAVARERAGGAGRSGDGSSGYGDGT